MNERLSRMDRYGQRNRTNPQRRDKAKTSRSRSAAVSDERVVPVQMSGLKGPEAEDVNVEKLPTRKELFPSQRLKWTRWFYNSLVYIFVIILIYLLWWGVSDSPWGEKSGL